MDSFAVRRTRLPRPVALVAATAVLAACGGEDDAARSGAVTGASPSATATPAKEVTEAVADLQVAAADLVRETSFEDKAGSERAVDEVEEAFEAARDGLAEDAERVEEELGGVKRAVGEGDLEDANREATRLLDVVNEAGGEASGSAAGSEAGLEAILREMKGAARDVDEEARFEDAKGTKRAAEAFEKLFDGSREEIESESPEAEEEIKAGLEDLEEALEGEDDRGQVRAASRKLVEAVDDAIAANG